MAHHAVSRPALARREALLTILGVALTCMFGVLLVRHLAALGTEEWTSGNAWHRTRFAAFVSTLVGLAYGIFVYLLSRLGYYTRLTSEPHVDQAERIDLGKGRDLPGVTVLVPSYKENESTILQTLVSAALQDYPGKRIVLLVDDPPNPTSQEDRELLEAARRAPETVRQLLAEPLSAARRASEGFTHRRGGTVSLQQEIKALAHAYGEAGRWFTRAGEAAEHQADHTARHYGEFVLKAHGRRLLEAADQVSRVVRRSDDQAAAIAGLYDRLVDQFDVSITSFERKRYVNLSHAANKAANLNSYLGLMGSTWHERIVDADRFLDPCDPSIPGAVTVPGTEFIITLDADSLLAHSYARHLVGHMVSDGNERVAVAQTPYSAIPNAASTVERVAGATTDIQYIVHQGFTWLGATFWVGANAVLRRSALDEIKTVEEERGFEVPLYIQDRTVIEDTESTIDLAARGWQLHNLPLRLAYSATPSDFGSLLIQRRRWANGGLLILPKMVRYALHRRWARFGFVELLVRTHYLISPGLSSLSMLALITLPVSEAYLTPWLALAGVPYLLLYWRDLILTGYRRTDLFRVFAFNWLLVPINLAGFAKSVQQGLTGQKIPFGRTPKVEGRTAAPAWAVASLVLLMIYVAAGVAWNGAQQQWLLIFYGVLTLAGLVYSLHAFVGVREALEDLTPLGRSLVHGPRSAMAWCSARVFDLVRSSESGADA